METLISKGRKRRKRETRRGSRESFNPKLEEEPTTKKEQHKIIKENKEEEKLTSHLGASKEETRPPRHLKMKPTRSPSPPGIG